jgi:hypothetical protein
MLTFWLRRAWLAASGLLALAGPAAGADTPIEPFQPSLDPAPLERWFAPLGATALADERVGGPRRLWLGLSGGVAASPGERERVFGLVELGVGLDTWVAERAPAGAAEEPETEEVGELGAFGAGVNGGSGASGGFPISAPQASPVGLGAAGGAPTPAPSAPGLRRQPRCEDPWSCDPANAAALARATVAEALRVRGSARELLRLDGMASRSRAAASLPEVRVGAGTSRDESLRQNPTLTDPGRFTRDGGRDLWLEARLTWRLDGAIFASDEIAIMRLRAQQREDSARLAREVLEALIDWQRARLALAGEAVLPEELAAAALRQFGAVARLDVLTDGWFSRYLAAARPRPMTSTGPDACGSAAAGLQGPHGFRDSAGISGTQKARRCAKGASLTSLNSSAN